MLDTLSYVLSLIGILYTGIEIIGTIIKGTSSFYNLMKFLIRFLFRKNRYYRNFRGLRIEYWLDRSKIVADKQRARFSVQIENVSQSSFSQIMFFFKLPKSMKIIRPKNIIEEELRDGQTVKYVDKIDELGLRGAVKRQYELSYEGKDLFVHMKITPFIVATKEINGKKESLGPEQLKGLSLKVKRKP